MTGEKITTVHVSTKMPGGRWRTGRQFGPEPALVEASEDDLRALLADPYLRVVTLDAGPLPAGATGQTGGTAEKAGLEPESTNPPGATVPAGGPDVVPSKKK